MICYERRNAMKPKGLAQEKVYHSFIPMGTCTENTEVDCSRFDRLCTAGV